MDATAKLIVAITCIVGIGCQKDKQVTEAIAGQEVALPSEYPNVPNASVSFVVEGLCEICKERIEGAARAIHGVKAAMWSVETKVLRVEWEGISPAQEVSRAVAAVGHDTRLDRAPDEAYLRLPDSCKYR